MTEAIEKTTFNQPIVYNVTEEGLRMLENKWSEVPDCVDKAGYELVRGGIGELRGLRVSVDKRRKELKSDALAYGKKVDSTAKEIIARLEPIEDKLKAAKAEIDEAKASAKAEKERVERERVDGHKAVIARITALGRLEYGATLDTMRANLEAVVNVDTSKESMEEFAMEAQVEQSRIDELLNTAIASETARIEAEKAATAERERIAEQQRIEAERLAEEHAKQERARMELEARQEAQRKADAEAEAERKRLADEAQAKIDAENAKAEADRAAKQKAIDDAAEEKRAAEQAHIDAEYKRIAEVRAKIKAEEDKQRQQREAEAQKQREEDERRANAETLQNNADEIKLALLEIYPSTDDSWVELVTSALVDNEIPHVRYVG